MSEKIRSSNHAKETMKSWSWLHLWKLPPLWKMLANLCWCIWGWFLLVRTAAGETGWTQSKRRLRTNWGPSFLSLQYSKEYKTAYYSFLFCIKCLNRMITLVWTFIYRLSIFSLNIIPFCPPVSSTHSSPFFLASFSQYSHSTSLDSLPCPS